MYGYTATATIALLLVARVNAYTITLYNKETQCFQAFAPLGATCTGKYEVLSDEESAVEISVVGPLPKQQVFYRKVYDGNVEEKREESGEAFQFDAVIKGDYTMCLTNGVKNDSNTAFIPSTIAFNFHVGLAKQQSGGERSNYNSLLVELDTLQQGLDFIKDHESFMNQREDLHKDSLDAINGEVLYWTVLESVILVCLSIWQVTYINRIFETKKSL